MKVLILTGMKKENIEEYFNDLKQDVNECFEYLEGEIHPDYYHKKIREVLIKNKLNDDFLFVIKTLQELPVNSIGYFIFEDFINKENVRVIFCDKENERESYYNEEGYLKNYALGYYLPELE